MCLLLVCYVFTIGLCSIYYWFVMYLLLVVMYLLLVCYVFTIGL